MLFSSPPFLLFFAAYLPLHVLLPVRHRLTLIIVGSTIFYGYWNPYYVWIPHVLLLIAYLGTIWMENARGTDRHRLRAIAVIALLLMPLVAVKYANFIYQDMLGPLFGLRGRVYDVALPLGISFITFTTIAYVVDVYRGHYRVERDIKRVAGLILFFPHLIAGPILRPRDLMPQFAHPRPALPQLGMRMVFGIAIFSVGLMKKLVFADPVSESVDAVFDIAGAYTAPQYLLGIYGFALQIYCDFSGYTDMAIGVAIIIGIKLPRNFHTPYASASIIEFWRRWHISLSNWLRDYLYIPLGGNRLGAGRQAANIFVTMTLGGLWHGANWTFVLWGMYHGLGVGLAHFIRRTEVSALVAGLPRWVKVLATFHFVLAGWILFRAPDLATAWRVMAGPFSAPLGDVAGFTAKQIFPLALLGIFFLTHRWDHHRALRRLVRKMPGAVFWPAVVLMWVLAITVSAGGSAKFIYFDF